MAATPRSGRRCTAPRARARGAALHGLRAAAAGATGRCLCGHGTGVTGTTETTTDVPEMKMGMDQYLLIAIENDIYSGFSH